MDKKAKIKSGLFFGTAMAIFFIMRSLLESENPTSKNVTIIIAAGIAGGAIAGLIFGCIMGLFANSKLVTKATKIDLESR